MLPHTGDSPPRRAQRTIGVPSFACFALSLTAHQAALALGHIAWTGQCLKEPPRTRDPRRREHRGLPFRVMPAVKGVVHFQDLFGE
jgi:hypothetical protein